MLTTIIPTTTKVVKSGKQRTEDSDNSYRLRMEIVSTMRERLDIVAAKLDCFNNGKPSLRALAQKLKVDPTTMSKIGRTGGSGGDTLTAFAHWGVNVNWLLTGIGVPMPKLAAADESALVRARLKREAEKQRRENATRTSIKQPVAHKTHD